MADLPQMNDAQLKQARKLIHSRCCNYDNGSCLALDWSFCNVCPQWITYSLNCKWFRNAVLPNDPALEASILHTQPRKRCVICGKPVLSKSHRAKYCPACSVQERRRRDAERKRVQYWNLRI